VGKCDAPISPSDARRLIDRDQELQEPAPFDIAGIPPPCLRYSRLTIARRKPPIDSGGEGVVTSIERINVHMSGQVNRHGDKRRSAPPHRTSRPFRVEKIDHFGFVLPKLAGWSSQNKNLAKQPHAKYVFGGN